MVITVITRNIQVNLYAPNKQEQDVFSLPSGQRLTGDSLRRRYHHGWCDRGLQEDGRQPGQRSHAHRRQLRWPHHAGDPGLDQPGPLQVPRWVHNSTAIPATFTTRHFRVCSVKPNTYWATAAVVERMAGFPKSFLLQWKSVKNVIWKRE